MFEKEYITQKILLFFSMILILTFAGRYLSAKNGISSYEGSTYAISNTSESLAESPYNDFAYNTEEVKKNVANQPYFFSIYHIGKYIDEMQKDYKNSCILSNNSEEYTNSDWIENSYYTSLLSVADENKFQYSTVVGNCITTQKAPIYYCILHTISSIFGSLSLYRLGFAINVCFLFLSSFLILSIGKHYFHASWAGFAAALLFSLSLGCFSGTICATPYIMTIFFLLLTVSLHLSVLTSKKFPRYMMECIAVVHVIGNLTDYSYLLFSTILFICSALTLLYYKRGKDLLKLLLTNIIALLITALIYPSFVLHIATVLFATKAEILAGFSWNNFSQACLNNLTVLNNQMFVKTCLLMGCILLILMVLAAFLKRDTFKNLFANFRIRISQMDMSDIFVPFLAVLYFFGICFFYHSELYFVLMTLLPFLALTVCYLCYRLCNAAIHSEFNSGLFGILCTCFLCFFTIATSSPRYIYADEVTQLNFASAYSQQYCIFLSSEDLTAADHILELEKYEHSIVLDADNLETLKQNETFSQQDRVLVYLSNKDYVQGRMDEIAKYGDFKVTKELTNYRDKNANHIYVYQLTKLK